MPTLNKSRLPKPGAMLNKSLLPSVDTLKAMSEEEKRRELAEIDRLLDELEGEDLFSSIEEDGDTQKAAGHKYIRKYKVGSKWRYVYANKGDRHSKGSQISHSRVIGKDEHLTEGSHFSLGPGKGHMVIESTSGDKVTYTVDGKGEKKTVSKAEFKKKVLEAHRPQVEAHAKAGLERREDILQRARKVDPNSKQTARAEKELARWKQEAKDFLPKQGQRLVSAPPIIEGVRSSPTNAFKKNRLSYTPGGDYISDGSTIIERQFIPKRTQDSFDKKAKSLVSDSLNRQTLNNMQEGGLSPVLVKEATLDGVILEASGNKIEADSNTFHYLQKTINPDQILARDTGEALIFMKDGKAVAVTMAMKPGTIQARKDIANTEKFKRERRKKLTASVGSASAQSNEQSFKSLPDEVGGKSYKRLLNNKEARRGLYIQEGNKWTTNGSLMLTQDSLSQEEKSFAKEAGKGVYTSFRASDSDMQNMVDMHSKNATQEVVFQEKAQKLGKSFEYGFLRAGDRSIEANLDYIGFVYRRTGADSVFADPKDPRAPLVFKKKGETVGLVMPMAPGELKRQGKQDTRKALGTLNKALLPSFGVTGQLTLDKSLLPQTAATSGESAVTSRQGDQ